MPGAVTNVTLVSILRNFSIHKYAHNKDGCKTHYFKHSARELSMTIGSLSNYHTYLHNIRAEVQKYDDTIVDRYSDPTTGAISYHGGYRFQATKHIAAGDEIFEGENKLGVAI